MAEYGIGKSLAPDFGDEYADFGWSKVRFHGF
jgi:hypothetical protein